MNDSEGMKYPQLVGFFFFLLILWSEWQTLINSNGPRKMPFGMAEITTALKVHLGQNKLKKKARESREKPHEYRQGAGWSLKANGWIGNCSQWKAVTWRRCWVDDKASDLGARISEHHFLYNGWSMQFFITFVQVWQWHNTFFLIFFFQWVIYYIDGWKIRHII